MTNLLPKDLPKDIMLDIHFRLPIKSLVRFKIVCKQWRSWFSDPMFIKMHLNRTIVSNKVYLLLRNWIQPEDKNSIYQTFANLEVHDMAEQRPRSSSSMCFMHGNELVYGGTPLPKNEKFSLCDKETGEEFGILDVPFPSKTVTYTIVGSSSGLICLTQSYFNEKFLNLNMLLWNPATRECRELPNYCIDAFTGSFIVSGLGFTYHPVVNDYKVVRIIYCVEINVYEVATYSLQTDCWRKIDHDLQGCHFQERVSQVAVNGPFHWLVTVQNEMGNQDENVLSFDIGEDTLDGIMLPDFGYPDCHFLGWKYLLKYKDSLAMFVHMPYQMEFDIWVMEECGEEFSWIKTLSISLEGDLLLPVYTDGDDAIIMKQKSDGELVLCDSNFGKIKNLQVYNCAYARRYIESLLSPYP